MAATARLIARFPIVPFGDNAIHCTRSSVAFCRIFQFGAGLARGDRVYSDNSGAVLTALAALLVTKIKSAPASDFTVHRTFFVVAALS